MPEGFESDEVGGDGVVAELSAVLERVRLLRGQVGGASGWSSGARRATLEHLDALSASVGLLRGPVMLAERDAGTSPSMGDRSFESAVGRATGKGFVEARREVRQAETLAAMPPVADAVDLGGMTLAHVDAIAKVVAGANGGGGARVLETEAGQAAVVALASQRDAGEFQKELSRYIAAQDPAAHDRDHATQRSARYLVLSDQADGTHVKGRLDRFAGERLRLALESTGVEPDGDRDRGQAMADALVALADTALTGAGTGASASQRRPHVSLLLREDTFAALLAEQRRRGHLGSAVGAQPGGERVGDDQSDAVSPATTAGVARGAGAPPAAVSESGLPVARSEVARILCDATVARIVVDAQDVPLNVGRESRLYSGAQRRAVIARDKQCAWPGCGIPARWAEVHHIRWWARDGGETSVENGVLLCEHHHHLVHQHDLDVRRHRPDDPGPGIRRTEPPPTSVAQGVRYTFRTRSGRLVAPAAVSDAAPSPVATTAPAPGSARRSGTVGAKGALDRPAPTGPAPSGPEARAAAGPGRASRRSVQPRAVQPSLLDTLIAAQPPDPPF